VADKQPKYDELLPPSDKQDAVGKKVFEILEEIINEKVRLGLHEKWLRHYRLGRNQPWTGIPPANVPLSSVPLLFTHRQRTVNTLTDNDPTFNVPPLGDDGDQDVYKTIGRSADYWWREQEQQAILEKSIINGETYGVAIEKVVFNPDVEYGMGEVETVVVDPFYFGLYPVTCQEVQKAEAVVFYRPMTVREAKRLWPGQAANIKSDTDLLTQLGDDRRDHISPSPDGKQGVVGRLRAWLGGGAESTGLTIRKDELLVCECWVRDYTMETVKQKGEPVMTEGPDGKPVQAETLMEITKPKYPGFIRCVTVCCNGKVVLDDKPNPSISPLLSTDEAMRSYLYDKFPFAVTNSITDPCTIWGMSDFEQLDSLQKEMNKCLSQIIYHKDRCARPKVINPRDSGVHNSQFTNRLGVINPSSFASGQGIRYLEFPNNTQDIQAVFELVKSMFMLVGGTFDMDQAASVNGDSRLALKSIQTLIERQATMMRGKIRNYYRLIRERGRMFVSLMQNWYTEDRWISFQDKGQEFTQPINGKRLRVPVRLTVVNGSTMPISRTAQREEARELFRDGAIDRRGLHDAMDWPNRAELDNRMDQGPNGVLLQRMAQAGFPSPGVQWVQQLGALDDKSFAIQLSKQQLPPPPVQLDPNDPAAAKQQLANQKTAAEIATMQAEARLKDAQAQAALSGASQPAADPDVSAREEARKDAELDLKRQHMDIQRLDVVGRIRQSQTQDRRADMEGMKQRHAMTMDAQAADLEAAKARMESDHRDKDREAKREADVLAQQTALAQTQIRGNSTSGQQRKQ